MRVKGFLKDSRRYTAIPFVLTVNLLAQLWSMLKSQGTKRGSWWSVDKSMPLTQSKQFLARVKYLQCSTALNNKDADKDSIRLPVIFWIYVHKWISIRVFVATHQVIFHDFPPHVSPKCIPSYTMVWGHFTMQHESGWITIEFHDCWANSRNLYPFLFSHSSIFYAFKQPWKEWPTSIPHLLECTSTIIRSTSETNGNDSKNPHTPWFQTTTLFHLHIHCL